MEKKLRRLNGEADAVMIVGGWEGLMMARSQMSHRWNVAIDNVR